MCHRSIRVSFLLPISEKTLFDFAMSIAAVKSVRCEFQALCGSIILKREGIPCRPRRAAGRLGCSWRLRHLGIQHRLGRPCRRLPAGAQERGLEYRARTGRTPALSISTLPSGPAAPVPLAPCAPGPGSHRATSTKPSRPCEGGRTHRHGGRSVGYAPGSRAACRRAWASAGCAARTMSDLPGPTCGTSRPRQPWNVVRLNARVQGKARAATRTSCLVRLIGARPRPVAILATVSATERKPT